MGVELSRAETHKAPTIHGDQSEIAAMLSDYNGDTQAFMHDTCRTCCMCQGVFYCGPEDEHYDRHFERQIRTDYGEDVCHADVSPYLEWSREHVMTEEDMRREWGTW